MLELADEKVAFAMKAIAHTNRCDLQPPTVAGSSITQKTAVGIAQIETATGRFVRVSQRFADIVGYSIQELEHLDFHILIDDLKDEAADLDSMRRLMAGEACEFAIEKRYHRRDGSVLWLNVDVSSLEAHGKLPGISIVVVEDTTDSITELKSRSPNRLFRFCMPTSPAFGLLNRAIFARPVVTMLKRLKDGMCAKNEASACIWLPARGGSPTWTVRGIGACLWIIIGSAAEPWKMSSDLLRTIFNMIRGCTIASGLRISV